MQVEIPIFLAEKLHPRFLYDNLKFDEIEIRFYKELLPNLIQFTHEHISDKKCTENSLQNMVAKFYSGDYSLEKGERGFYLVLKDLANCNYIMKTGPEGLNFQQLNDILVKLAKFHSTAYAFNIKNPEIIKKWNLESWQEKTSNDPKFISRMEKNMDNFIKDLVTEEPNLVKPVTSFRKRWDFLDCMHHISISTPQLYF